MTAILVVVGTWLLLLPCLWGLGTWLVRWLAIEPRGLSAWIDPFWLGWALLLTLLPIWQLALPLNVIALISFALLGALGALVNRHLLKNAFGPLTNWRASTAQRQRQTALFVIVFGCFALWLANRATSPISTSGDAGLYHIGMIRWLSEYSIVPGLGNLHGRFAFNNAYFLYLAWLDSGPWQGYAQHFGGSLLLFMLGAESVEGLVKIATARGAIRAEPLCKSLLAPLTVYLCFTASATTSPDFPVFVLGVVVGQRLCRLLFYGKDSQYSVRAQAFDVLLMVVLCAVGVTMKLSFVAFGTLASLVAVTVLLSNQGWKIFVAQRKLVASSATIVVVLALGWLVRNVILSGYLIYPSTLVAFDVPWRIRIAQTVDEAKWIASWARQPWVYHDEVLASWAWLGPWSRELAGEWFTVGLPLVVALLGLLMWIVRHNRRFVSLPTLLLISPLGWLIFWFFTAPAIRFAGAAFWLLGTSVLVLGATGASGWQRRAVAGLAVSLVALSFVYGLARQPLLIPASSAYVLPPLPKPEIVQFTTNSGWVLNVPAEGYNCWGAPLPCTPYPSADHALLGDQLTDGIVRYNNEIQIDWPNSGPN